MQFIGKNNAYIETSTVTENNVKELLHTQPSELMLLWFESDGNTLLIDNVSYTFNRHDIVCLTEFHEVSVTALAGAKLIKWNKYFYCIVNHDSEVGCKGILYYGAVDIPIIHLDAEQVGRIGMIWRMLTQEMLSKDSLQEEMLQMTLKRLLVQCTRIYKSQTGMERMDAEVSDLIREYHFLVEKHFKSKHQVADYAEMLEKSPKTLANFFKKIGSKSPQQYIKDRKMLEARRLLAYSALTISEVGSELGFSDVQSFSRFFKREQGISPVFFKEESLTGKIAN